MGLFKSWVFAENCLKFLPPSKDNKGIVTCPKGHQSKKMDSCCNKCLEKYHHNFKTIGKKINLNKHKYLDWNQCKICGDKLYGIEKAKGYFYCDECNKTYPV